jgi:hypothetical protein
LHLHFDIVIGRRTELSDAELEQKAAFRDHHMIEVMSYDRFMDAARQLDAERSLG